MKTDAEWQMYAYFLNKGLTLEYLMNLSIPEKMVYIAAMDWGVRNGLDLNSYAVAQGIEIVLSGGRGLKEEGSPQK